MAYEMLTGRLPFEADTPWQWATQHMTAQPFPFEAMRAAAGIPPAMKRRSCGPVEGSPTSASAAYVILRRARGAGSAP